MADPHTSGPRRAPEPAAEDDARIEHLLVNGLDHYFAGEYEQAINLWTRVLFLDRHHDRARAYIDRARSAQAERQRQSEALVHQGLDAFDRGDVEQARTLLSDALARGASHDLALGVLGRIDRLAAGAARGTAAGRSGRPLKPTTAIISPGASRVTNPSRFWTLNLVVIAGLCLAS